MRSGTPVPATLKPKSAMENGRSGCEFGMMARAFRPRFWKKAAQNITASPEYANAPDKSAQT